MDVPLMRTLLPQPQFVCPLAYANTAARLHFSCESLGNVLPGD
jgi:hypothetical protein